MIKLLRFTSDAALPWVPSRASTSPLVAPLRITRNQVLVDQDPFAAAQSAIDIAYFADLAHLERFRREIADDDVAYATWGEGQVATEKVLRGDTWLTDRWLDSRPRYKHTALARRAAGLTQAEFSERWKAHAGTAGSAPIPANLQGLAYAQNHAVDGLGDVRYDAVNEAWFDDPDLLRERHRWLTENLPAEGDDDLFGARHLLLIEEQVLDLS